MKNYLKLLVLCIFAVFGSCKNETIVGCPEIYISLTANIKYVDSNKKDLIFGDNPTYPPEHIKIYRILPNGQTTTLNTFINTESRLLTVNLEKVNNGTFYIELKADVTDKIIYTAKMDESKTCGDYKLLELKQNDVLGQYDNKAQVWTLKK